MKKTLVALAVYAALVPSLAMAEAGDIVVRLRATNISAHEDSQLGKQTDKTGPASSAALYDNANAEVRVDSNTIPGLDLSYYITKNIAAELILALGSEHDVKINHLGAGAAVTDKDLGKVNLLPPTLTLQWHFNPDQFLDPYVGAGVTYVRAMNNGLNAMTGSVKNPIRIDRNMWGVALQAGLDVNLENKWLVNFDVKKIWVDTDVKLNADAALGGNQGYKLIDKLDIDPWVVSVGFGKKF